MAELRKQLWEMTDAEMLDYKIKDLPVGLSAKLRAFAEEYVSNGFKAGPAYLKCIAVSPETKAPDQAAYALLNSNKKLVDYILGLQARRLFQPGMALVRKELLEKILTDYRSATKDSAKAKFADILTRIAFPHSALGNASGGNDNPVNSPIQIIVQTTAAERPDDDAHDGLPHDGSSEATVG